MKNFSNIQTLNQKEVTLPFGKYKSIPISSIEDMAYLTWAVNQRWIDKDIRDAIDDQLNIVRFTHI